MIRDVISETHQNEPCIKSNKQEFDTQQAQEMIYKFLLELVRHKPPIEVLTEFRHIFIEYNPAATDIEIRQAITGLILANKETEFHCTLKRSCYILINNWETSRNHQFVKELLDIFPKETNNQKKLLSKIRIRQDSWLRDFVNSQSYQELKLFAIKHGLSDREHWSNRYTSYLLVPQYTNINNPKEQREAAKALSQKLKDKFKFDLAMYTARSQSPVYRDKIPNNPTGFGDDILRFIKMIVVRRGSFSYANLANIFLKQTQDLNYRSFKQSLQKYLICYVDSKDFVEVINQKFSDKLDQLYKERNDQKIDEALLLRTCNKIIDYLTTDNQKEPSGLFILLMSKGNPLTLVIVILKIILISPNSRIHMEDRIAHLIKYYTQYPEEECKWVINFFEVFNITFAIHADNVKYNLIKMNEQKVDEHSNLDTYRVFSQFRKCDGIECVTPEEAQQT